MAIARLLLGLWLILLVGQARGAWWSRSSCSRVNCVWGGWRGWGACNHPCGNAGTQSRSRGVARSASCGGSGCSGPSSQTRACNRFCNNGGTLQSAYCECPDEYWDTCCDKPCKRIHNCRFRRCTSGTNQHCGRCEHDHGGEKKAYRLVSRGGHSNRVCEKLCSWRKDSIFCYPGNCPDVPTSCQCAPGFGGPNCLTISTKPSIIDCLITAEVDVGSSVEKVEISCADESNPVVYSNVVSTTVKIDFKTAFKGPSASVYPRKYYINDFKVGITEAIFQYIVTRGE
ncbi:hypothetical protein NP493_1547g00000 [Ridgeia piscesae]|uniref:EGF-like domain-containing protein n=1 Tax=Ridgeia piscesae TaxID=27915 RepID=A0AAD9JYX5_RIDPI|nr:hypothetical protein NP493_1547g00000 [Ridgeia piscesae]